MNETRTGVAHLCAFRSSAGDGRYQRRRAYHNQAAVVRWRPRSSASNSSTEAPACTPMAARARVTASGPTSGPNTRAPPLPDHRRLRSAAAKALDLEVGHKPRTRHPSTERGHVGSPRPRSLDVALALLIGVVGVHLCACLPLPDQRRRGARPDTPELVWQRRERFPLGELDGQEVCVAEHGEVGDEGVEGVGHQGGYPGHPPRSSRTIARCTGPAT